LGNIQGKRCQDGEEKKRVSGKRQPKKKQKESQIHDQKTRPKREKKQIEKERKPGWGKGTLRFYIWMFERIKSKECRLPGSKRGKCLEKRKKRRNGKSKAAYSDRRGKGIQYKFKWTGGGRGILGIKKGILWGTQKAINCNAKSVFSNARANVIKKEKKACGLDAESREKKGAFKGITKWRGGYTSERVVVVTAPQGSGPTQERTTRGKERTKKKKVKGGKKYRKGSSRLKIQATSCTQRTEKGQKRTMCRKMPTSVPDGATGAKR